MSVDATREEGAQRIERRGGRLKCWDLTWRTARTDVVGYLPKSESITKILKAYSLTSRNCQRKEDRETSISLIPLPPRAF